MTTNNNTSTPIVDFQIHISNNALLFYLKTGLIPAVLSSTT